MQLSALLSLSFASVCVVTGGGELLMPVLGHHNYIPKGRRKEGDMHDI